MLQDVEQQADGEFAVKYRTVNDHIISTTDPKMRAGHTSASKSLKIIRHL
jgi:hypothetical protein